MPLYVGGNQVLETPESVVDFYRSYKCLQETGERLTKDPCVETPGNRLVYVCQREYAVVSPGDENVDFIGSDDATTCHIVVFRHTGSNVCGLGHLDGLNTKDFIHRMRNDVLTHSTGAPEGRLEIDIVGGFIDDRTESIKLSKEIMSILISDEVDCHLRTFFCTDVNDIVRDGVHYPLIYGLCINVKTGKIFPSSFKERGPDMNIRGCLCFAGYKKVHNVYDIKHGQLVIGPYTWKPHKHALEYSQLPNHVIRKYFSTSPAQEPVYFEDHVRTAFRTL